MLKTQKNSAATRIIAVINQKGGVGKTTSTMNIGAALAQLGKKVLLVDLDQEGFLSHCLGIDHVNLNETIYHVLTGKSHFKDVIIETSGLFVLPGSMELAELSFYQEAGWQLMLKNALKTIKGFDYILLDCPPSLGVLTVNALTFAKETIIPVQAEYIALEGLRSLLETFNKIKETLNPKLEITGIFGVRYSKRKNLNRQVLLNLRKHFGKTVCKTAIRENISVAEAPSFQAPIFAYKPKSKGAVDYLKLTKELIRRAK